MPRQVKKSEGESPKSWAKCQSKGKKKQHSNKVVNPWAYKVILPQLPENEKCNSNDIAMLECKPNFKVKPVQTPYTQLSRDKDLNRIFGELVNQKPAFMRQWVRIFTLTHKTFIVS